MDLNDYASLSIRVLEDWRVIAVAIGSILVWAILRRVGAVYRSLPSLRPPVVRGPSKSVASRRPPQKAPARPSSQGEEVVE